MCGEINRQSVGYKSVAHLSDVELASIDDFLSRPTLWNWPAICLSSEVRLPISKDIVQRSAPSSPSTDARPMLTMSVRAPPDYQSMLLGLKKNRASFGKLLTWPDGAPIVDGKRRWSADNPDNPQIIGRKCPFSPKNPSDRRRSLYVTRVLHKFHTCAWARYM